METPVSVASCQTYDDCPLFIRKLLVGGPTSSPAYRRSCQCIPDQGASGLPELTLHSCPKRRKWPPLQNRNRLARHNWPELPDAFIGKDLVFPILVTHDVRMDSPGTGTFL